MDFYLKVLYIILGVLVASGAIYMFMVGTSLVFKLIDNVETDAEITLTSAEEFDISGFDNKRSVSGTQVLPMIRDIGKHELAILVQTRGQNGTIVNYGTQLRGIVNITNPANLVLDWASADGIALAATELGQWERNYVFSSRSIFGKASVGILGPIMIGSSTLLNNSPSTGMTVQAPPLTNLYNGLDLVYTGALPTRVGVDVSGLPFFSPTVSFWNTINSDVALAKRLGEDYLTTGNLYTSQTLSTYADKNFNETYARDENSPYYINMTSSFHSAFIMDQSGVVVGIYFEEHGINNNSNLLAQGQIISGMLTEPLQH